MPRITPAAKSTIGSPLTTGAAGLAPDDGDVGDLVLDTRFVDEAAAAGLAFSEAAGVGRAAGTASAVAADSTHRPTTSHASLSGHHAQFRPVCSSRMGPRLYDLDGHPYRLAAVGGASVYNTVLQALKSIRSGSAANPIHSIMDVKALRISVADHLSRNRQRFVPLLLVQLINFINENKLELFPRALQNKLAPFVRIVQGGDGLVLNNILDLDTELGRLFPSIINAYVEALKAEGNWAGDLEITVLQEVLSTKIALHIQSTGLTLYYDNADDAAPTELYLLFDGIHYDFLTPMTLDVASALRVDRADIDPLENSLFEAAETQNLLADITFNSQTNIPEASVELAGTRFEVYRSTVEGSTDCPYATIWHVARTSARTREMMSARYPDSSSLRQNMASTLRTNKALYLSLVCAQIQQAIESNELHLFVGQLKTFAETQQRMLRDMRIARRVAGESFFAAVNEEGYDAYCNFIESRQNHWLRSLEIGLLADFLGLEVLLYMPDGKNVIRSHKVETLPRIHLHWTGREHKLLSPPQRVLVHEAAPFAPLSSTSLRASGIMQRIEGDTTLPVEGAVQVAALGSVVAPPEAAASAAGGVAAHPIAASTADALEAQQRCLNLLFDKARTFVAPGSRRLGELAKLMPEKSFSLTVLERAAIEQDYAVKKSVLLASALLIGQSQFLMEGYDEPLSREGFILSFDEIERRIRGDFSRIIEDYRERYIKRLASQGLRWSEEELLSARSWTKKGAFKRACEQAVILFNMDIQAIVTGFLQLDEAYKLYEYSPESPEFSAAERVTLEAQIARREAEFNAQLESAQHELARAQEGMSLTDQLNLGSVSPEAARASQRQQDALFKWAAVVEFLQKHRELLTAYRAFSTRQPVERPGLSTVELRLRAYFESNGGAATPHPFCQPRTAVELQKQFIYLLETLARFNHGDLKATIGDFDGNEPNAEEPLRPSRFFPGLMVGGPGYREAKDLLHAHFNKKLTDILATFLRIVKAWNINKLATDPAYQKLFVRDQMENLRCEMLALRSELDNLENHRRIHGVELQTALPINSYELQKERLRVMLPDHLDEVAALALPEFDEDRQYLHHETFPAAVELLRRYYSNLNPEQARDLIIYGLPVNFTDAMGKTLLHHALDCNFDSYDKNLEHVVRHLLNLNASVILEDTDGMSPGALVCFNAPTARLDSELPQPKKEIRQILIELLARAYSSTSLQQKVQDFAHTYGAEMERIMIEELTAARSSSWSITKFMFPWVAAGHAVKRKETVDALRVLIYQTARANHNLFDVFNHVLAHIKRVDETYGGSNLLRLVRDLTMSHSRNIVFREAVFDLIQARSQYHTIIEVQNRALPARQNAARFAAEQRLREIQAENERLRQQTVVADARIADADTRVADADTRVADADAREAAADARTAALEAELARLRSRLAADEGEQSPSPFEVRTDDGAAAVSIASGPGMFTGPQRTRRRTPESAGAPAPAEASAAM